MRGKRQKQYRKLMHKYQLTFAFREPYQVLLDAQIIIDAARCKMQLGHLLQQTLHGAIKPMITTCSIRHLYQMPPSPEKEAWIAVAKSAERRRCGHHELEAPLTELECVESVVDPKGNGTNKFRYVVASQDVEIRRKMRGVVGVPLVYISRSVMILEPMAEKSERVKEGEEKAKIKAGLKFRRGAEKRKRDDEEDDDGEEESGKAGEARDRDVEEPAKKKVKAKGPKGPNPLSVKKAKKEEPTSKNKQGDERAATRRATKADSQAADRGELAATANDESGHGVTDETRKRKRKRKPKDATAGAEATSVADGED
ncbi:rRNA-processing utp23 [Lecanosticta acicola]|uniref:U three protein 23 n=1 Tax=Lecanosticta acicola TaxID=111012 RepID=A0AAI8Z2P0_9PEZI|nr:rRNA-processing utp23 [Lecanosticta acicola]